jgi:polyphosphate kinase
MRGVSNRIRVRSVVGRFLEHTRIFYFANAGDEEIYVGSADWMPRNLYERVEVTFPVRDAMLRQRVKQEILDVYLADSKKARHLKADGSYGPAERGGVGGRAARPAGFSAQDFLIALAEGRADARDIPEARRTSRSRRVSRAV